MPSVFSGRTIRTIPAAETSVRTSSRGESRRGNSPLGQQTFAAIAVTANADGWNRHQFPSAKKQWLSAALRDAATRAELIWKTPTLVETRIPHADALFSWAKSLKLQQVAALRPEVGLLHDSLPSLRTALAKEGIRLALINRAEDLRVRPFATAGFFQFWDRLRLTLDTNSTGKDFPEPQRLIQSLQ
jgi:hypothetical protein